MTISELTKRKGGNNIGIAFGEQNRKSKRRRSTTYCEILTKQQHLTKGLLQSKKKKQMFVADRLATLAVAVALRIDCFEFVLKSLKVK